MNNLLRFVITYIGDLDLNNLATAGTLILALIPVSSLLDHISLAFTNNSTHF